MTERCSSGEVGPSCPPDDPDRSAASPESLEEPPASDCGAERPAPLFDGLPAELPAVSPDVTLETFPETASPLLSSAEQAASSAVMVRAVKNPVRSPAVRDRVAVRVMAVRRDGRAGRFRP
jgi:hypothetical protein